MVIINKINIESLNKIRKCLKLNKLYQSLENLEEFKEDLEYIKSLVDEYMKKGLVIFNISTAKNVNLAYKLFKKGEQYTFGDEKYHYHHIKISVLGLIRLNKKLNKINKKIDKLNKKIESMEEKND